MKPLRKETYRVKRPNYITFGDPYYYEKYRGEQLMDLVCDLSPPKEFDARIVLREDRIGTVLRDIKIYLAPAETMQTYLGGETYPYQYRDIKDIGVDTACYMLSIDSREHTVHTAADRKWGSVEKMYHYVGWKKYIDAIIITVEVPETYDFAALKRMAKFLFPDMIRIRKEQSGKSAGQADRQELAYGQQAKAV